MGETLAGLFSGRAAAWLVGVGASSLGLLLAFLVAGAPQSAEVRSAGTDAFSRSALGHRAFVELLRRSGTPVLVSRYDSASRAIPSGVLVLAEPRIEDKDSARGRRLTEMLEQSWHTLVVLPKWDGVEDPARPGWIREAKAIPLRSVAQVLSAARVPARVIRKPRSGAERCEGLPSAVTLREPQLLEPTTDAVRPLVSCDGGVLLGYAEIDTGMVYVLSDPDLIANHGLAAGNEQAAREIVGIVGGRGQALVFDEVLHGHERIPALWRELFTFPLLPGVVQGLLALAMLCFAGLGRFGAPVPAALGLGAGKGLLIENTAALLRTAGYSGHTLGRYFEAALAEAAAAIHAPQAVRAEERRAWLAAAAARRGTSVDLATLEAQVERATRPGATASAVVAAARRVHRFREEMRRGASGHPGR